MSEEAKDASVVGRYTIDCSHCSPVKVGDFAEYLRKHIKVHGLRNKLEGRVHAEPSDSDSKVIVTAYVKFAKRNLRYYARKFLTKQQLREHYRIVSQGKNDYEVRPYKVTSDK